MKERFALPDLEICKTEEFDVITTSVLNSNGKLDGGDFGGVISFDDTGA